MSGKDSIEHQLVRVGCHLQLGLPLTAGHHIQMRGNVPIELAAYSPSGSSLASVLRKAFRSRTNASSIDEEPLRNPRLTIPDTWSPRSSLSSNVAFVRRLNLVDCVPEVAVSDLQGSVFRTIESCETPTLP